MRVAKVLVLAAFAACTCRGQTASCKGDELSLDGECWQQVLKIGGRAVGPQIVWPKEVGRNPNGASIWMCPSEYVPYLMGRMETCIPKERGPVLRQSTQITPPVPVVASAPNSAALTQTTSAPQPVQAPTPAPVQPAPTAIAPDPAAARAAPIPFSGQIPSGAVIAIAPMGGFDTYLAAAFREKKTPVQLTIDPAQSDYLLVSSQYEWQGWFANSSGAAHGSANWNSSGGTADYNAHSSSNAGSTRGLEASLMLIDKRTGRVLWAYEVHKSSHGSLLFGTFGMRGQQSIAEACAKHLKEYIEKGKG